MLLSGGSILLIVAFLASSCRLLTGNEPPPLTAALASYGIYESGAFETTIQTSHGVEHLRLRIPKHRVTTNVVHPAVGVSFGFSFTLAGGGPKREVPLQLLILHPPFRGTNGEVETAILQRFRTVPGFGHPANWTFEIRNREQFAAGEWRFEVRHHDDVLLRKSFNVEPW